MTEDEIRAQVEAAIYAKLQNEADGDDDPVVHQGAPFILGWALVYEFTSEGMEDAEQTAVGQIIASNTQARATSRGLFELGVDRFRT